MSKYSVPGKILMTCHCVAGDICRAVEDEGLSIPPQNSGTMFNAFYRTANVRSKKTASSGLGLVVVS